MEPKRELMGRDAPRCLYWLEIVSIRNIAIRGGELAKVCRDKAKQYAKSIETSDPVRRAMRACRPHKMTNSGLRVRPVVQSFIFRDDALPRISLVR